MKRISRTNLLDPTDLVRLQTNPPRRMDLDVRLLGLLQRLGLVRQNWDGVSEGQFRCVRQCAVLIQATNPQILEIMADCDPMPLPPRDLVPSLLSLSGRNYDDPETPQVVAVTNMLHQAFKWGLPFHSPDSQSAGYLSALTIPRDYSVVSQPDGLFSVVAAFRGKGIVTIAANLPDKNTALGLAATLQSSNQRAIKMRSVADGAFRATVRNIVDRAAPGAFRPQFPALGPGRRIQPTLAKIADIPVVRRPALSLSA